MKVSVIVPVYNTGPYIHDLIDSLRAQTLDPSEFEAIFVDDGSTDDTPALLDRVEVETPHLRVIHQQNHGWPGQPRNVGIASSRGRYVFFADHDDKLDPEALARLTAFADEHGSDVVLGKVEGRNSPVRIFTESVIDGQHDLPRLMTSLTPHKMFRRQFLDEVGLRFPEGRRRLEDHLFVTTAYLRAARVSIYAERTCYFFQHRDDGGNASKRTPNWTGYFGNVAECIAVVDAEAPDDETRIAMRRRWLRNEALSRVKGRSLLHRTEDRAEMVAAIRVLLREHYPLAEIDRLSVADRIAARLVLGGDDQALEAFARWQRDLRLRPQVTAARLGARRGVLRLELTAAMESDEPTPSVLSAPPAGYPDLGEMGSLRALPADLEAVVTLRPDVAATGAVRRFAVKQSITDDVLTVTATRRVGPGRDPALPPLQPTHRVEPGRWTVHVRFRDAGELRPTALRVAPEQAERVSSSTVVLGPNAVALAVEDSRVRLTITPVPARPVASPKTTPAPRPPRPPRPLWRRVALRVRRRLRGH